MSPTGPKNMAPAAAFPTLNPFLLLSTNFQPSCSPHIGHQSGALLMTSSFCILFYIRYSILNYEYIISYQIKYNVNKGGVDLAKFVARKPEKEVISLRIPTDTLQEIDEKAAIIEISRNELINQMIQYALSNMEDPSAKE